MSTALILLSEFQKTEIELWRPIVSCPGYDVSNLGRVRSWRRSAGQGRWRGAKSGRRLLPRLVKQCVKDTGRLQVSLSIDGRSHTVQVHLLVGREFLENPDGLPQLNHKTGLYTDNRVGNLEYVTAQQNSDHAVKHGLMARGERMALAKLRECDVRDIRGRLSRGETQRDIASAFGVSQRLVCLINLNRIWRHVK